MSTKTCQQNQNIRPKGRRHSGNSSVRHSRVVRHSRGRSTRLRQLGPQRTVKRLSWLSLPLLFRDSKFHPGALCARVTIPPIASGLHLKTGHCRFQTRPPRVELGQCQNGRPRRSPARPVGSLARLRTSAVTSALARSAASLRATLTPDDVAIGRASAAVTRLDAMIESMRRDGTEMKEATN
jgi:hypothetical protein